MTGERPAMAWLKLLPLAIAAITMVTFLPALYNEFVNWDDDKVLLDNYGWRGLAGPQLRWMFTSGMQGHYHPLTWVSFAIDYLLWGGLDPGGFHLTNVLWHALNAALFYLLALRLLQMTMPGDGGPVGHDGWSQTGPGGLDGRPVYRIMDPSGVGLRARRRHRFPRLPSGQTASKRVYPGLQPGLVVGTGGGPLR